MRLLTRLRVYRRDEAAQRRRLRLVGGYIAHCTEAKLCASALHAWCAWVHSRISKRHYAHACRRTLQRSSFARCLLAWSGLAHATRRRSRCAANLCRRALSRLMRAAFCAWRAAPAHACVCAQRAEAMRARTVQSVCVGVLVHWRSHAARKALCRTLFRRALVKMQVRLLVGAWRGWRHVWLVALHARLVAAPLAARHRATLLAGSLHRWRGWVAAMTGIKRRIARCVRSLVCAAGL